MHLKRISLIGFKNYNEADIRLSPGVNCFTGPNGSGKTNILDAVHYLGFCKSFSNPIDSQNIMHGIELSVIEGIFRTNDDDDKITCSIGRNRKKIFKRNKKSYDKLMDHIGRYPMVLVTPSDQELILGFSDTRRRFLDKVIAQCDPKYLSALTQYNTALRQRNQLLKNFARVGVWNEEEIVIWDDRLVHFSEPIHTARSTFINDFTPLFNKLYHRISDGRESVSLFYMSSLDNTPLSEDLQNCRMKDRALQHTTVGIHKDELAFLIEDRPMKRFGSQGQQKSFVTALKLSELEYIRKIKGIDPILILDDIFDRLDPMRVQAILEIIAEESGAQVLITDTRAERIETMLAKMDIPFSSFNVDDGSISTSKLVDHAEI